MTTPTFPPRTLKALACWALIPVLTVELALSPLSFAHLYLDYPWVPIVQLSITAFVLPLYLATLGVTFFWRSGVRQVLAGFAVLVAAVALLIVLDYSVWGISSGRFWAPDNGTVVIIRIAAEVALLVALVPALLVLVVRYIIEHARRNA